MAGDWIKWSKGLPDKPEVIRISGMLGISREVAVCRLMRFWEWCDDNIPDDAITESGSAFVTLSPRDGDNVAFIDALVWTPGFADSLAAVDWLRCRDGRIELPNFGRHNGETAKTRARNARNQKKMRQKPKPSEALKTQKPVIEMSPRDGDKTMTREEERREESSKEEKPPLPPADGGSRVAPAKRKTDPEADPLFARFWTAYPRKTAKPKAAVAFARLKPDEHLLARMLEAIGRQSQTEQWLRDGGQYIPHPATWIHGRRWEDMIQPTTGPPATFDPDAEARRTRERMERLRTQEPVIPNPEAKR